MSWQVLTAISVIAFSISNLLRRILLHDDKSDPVAYAIVFQGLSGLIISIYALVYGLQLPDFSRYWFAITLTMVLYALGNVASAKAFQQVEASVYSVLFATSAIWIIIVGSFVLHDQLSLLQLFGILLVLCGVFIISERKGTIKITRGVIFSLLTAALFGVAVVSWTYVARRSSVPTWAALSFLGPALITLAARPRAVIKMKPFLKKNVLITMLLLGVIFSISAVTMLFAYKRGNSNLVAALLQSSIIVTTILGVVFLRERKYLPRKALAASICLFGVMLIIS